MICRDTPTHGWVHRWLGGSVGQWVGSGHVTKYQINLDVIKIIQFCLKIYDLLTPTPMGGCMDQWVGQWVESGQMTNLIKFELINIISFCLKIPMDGCMGQWVASCQITKIK